MVPVRSMTPLFPGSGPHSVPSGRCGPGWSMLRPKIETHGPEWKPRQVAGLVVGSAACKVFRSSQSVTNAVGFAQSGKSGNSAFLRV